MVYLYIIQLIPELIKENKSKEIHFNFTCKMFPYYTIKGQSV